MSLFWNRASVTKVGGGAACRASFTLTNKRGLVTVADYCPCDSREWIIATMCEYKPDEECIEPEVHAMVGFRASFPSTLPSDPETAHPVADAPMYHSDGVTRVYKLVFEEGDWPGISYDAIRNTRIDAISHWTRAAPFECEINAVAYFDGAAVAETDGEVCAEGARCCLGRTEYRYSPNPIHTDTFESDCWQMGLTGQGVFVGDAGAHNLDLVVTLTPTAAALAIDDTLVPVKYSMRYPLITWGVDSQVQNLGGVAILPNFVYEYQESGGVFSVWVGEGEDAHWDRYIITKLFGWYATREIAYEVYSAFSSLISSWATSCACGGTHGHECYGDCFAADSYEFWPGFGYRLQLGSGPHVCIDAGFIFKGTRWVFDDFFLGEDCFIVAIDMFGNISTLTDPNTIPECCGFYFVCNDNEIDPAYQLSGNYWDPGCVPSNPTCPYCDSSCWDFTNHAWLQDGTYPSQGNPSEYCQYVKTTFTDGATVHYGVITYLSWHDAPDGDPHGIPGNQDDYEDWQEWLDSQEV